MKYVFTICFLFFASISQADFDVSYNYSHSASSKNHKARLGIQLLPEHKINISGSSIQLDSSEYADTQNSVFKLNYRYKINESDNITIDFKKINESYFFDGQAISVQYTHRFQLRQMQNFRSKISGKIEAGGRKYTQLDAENLSANSFEIGFEQELPQNFSAGLDLTLLSYDSKSNFLSSALKGRTVAENNINLYTSSLTKSSVSLFAEYTQDAFAVGGSINQDSPLIAGQTKYNTFEIYGDYQVDESLSLNASITRGRLVEVNSTSTSTVSLGLQYQF